MKQSSLFRSFLLLLFSSLNLVSAAQPKKYTDGSFLKAKIDGVAWEANKFVFDKYVSEIIQVWGDKGNSSLRFQLNKLGAGKTNVLDPTDMNSFTDDQFNMYEVVGKSGDALIQKMDDDWIEGAFHFDLKDKRSGKKLSITDGKFRIPNPKHYKE